MSLDRYISDINHAVDTGSPYCALALSLVLPDICGSIEYPNQKGRKRYIAWYDAWCAPISQFVTGVDCYALRCAYLHDGADELGPHMADQRLLDRLQISFNRRSAVSVQKSILYDTPNARAHVQIPLRELCVGMVSCVDAWRQKQAKDEEKQRRIAQLFRLRLPSEPFD
jgi:hypothetical protein